MKELCDICKVSLGRSYVRFVYTLGVSWGKSQPQEGMYIATYERVVGSHEREKVACLKCADKYDGIGHRWTVLGWTSGTIAVLLGLTAYFYPDMMTELDWLLIPA